MTKSDLVEKLYADNVCTKKDADELVTAVFDAIREALVAGDKVSIAKFGTFDVRHRDAREGNVPGKPGEKMIYPASNSVFFKSSKVLKDAMNAEIAD